MIEHVKELRAKFQFCALGNREILKQRKIPYLVTGALHAITGRISVRAERRISEGTGVDPRGLHSRAASRKAALGDRGLALRVGIGRHWARLEGVADHVGTRLAIGIREAVGIQNGEPVPGGKAGNAPDLPSADYVVKRTFGVAEQRLSMADGKFVEVAQHQAVANVEVGIAILPVRGLIETEVAAV